MDSLNQQLYTARKAKHLTQQEVGARLGWAQARVSAVETGRLDPRLTSVVQMGRLLEHEIILVPRTLLPAVQALITGKEEEPHWTPEDQGEDTP